MSNYRNAGKENFLASIPTESIDADSSDLTSRCRFNFSYFTVQAAGQDFPDWSAANLAQLFGKLREYTKFPLTHWLTQRAGNHAVLEIYDSFPKKSDFTHPRHVPHQARWARFRIEQAVRLVGFVLPESCRDRAHHKTGLRYDCNCFYVVFLDANHRFYLTEEK